MPENIQNNYPLATTGAAVEKYINKMRDKLKELKFGEVGLIFKVHEGFVVSVQEINEIKYRILKDEIY